MHLGIISPYIITKLRKFSLPTKLSTHFQAKSYAHFITRVINKAKTKNKFWILNCQAWILNNTTRHSPTCSARRWESTLYYIFTPHQILATHWFFAHRISTLFLKYFDITLQNPIFVLTKGLLRIMFKANFSYQYFFFYRTCGQDVVCR